MPSSSKTKRKSDRRNKTPRAAKSKKNAEASNNTIPSFEDGCDVVSSILEENVKSEGKIDDEIASIASDTLLCLEDVYCDTGSSQQPMSPNWGNEMSSSSLVIGDSEDASALRTKIQQLTSCHEVLMCKQEESFETCNSKGFVLVWLLMSMPVGPDILSLTTSIRYASKYNRSTVIIGVANTTSTVDLRLHGIDEIVIQPLDNDVIRQKYSKWSSVTILPDLTSSETDVKDNPSPENPKTPMSPSSTICTDNPDKGSGYSFSVDGSVGMGQLSYTKLNGGLNVVRNMTSQVGQHSGKQKYSSAADHTTKEKVRRERIKDSCDQLRVLLPYIRGRKTDMASILEMCVDYLKLVNAALPQDFQNQITEILAKDTAVLDSPVSGDKKSKPKKQDTETNAVSSTVDTDINNNDLKPIIYGGQNHEEGTKNLNNDQNASIKCNKRFRIQTDNFLTNSSSCLSGGLNLLSRPESSLMDQQQSSYSFNGGNLYNEYDVHNMTRTYGTHDSYPNTYYGSPLTAKQNGLDRDSFGLFLESQPFYQFYGSNSMCPYNMAPIPDYVNPNAVLPVSYDSKSGLGETTYDEQNNIVSSEQQPTSTDDVESKND